MGTDGFQPVVTVVTTTDLEPHPTEIQIEFVVDDDQVVSRDRVELGERADLTAGLVHVGAGFGHEYRLAAEAYLGGPDVLTYSIGSAEHG